MCLKITKKSLALLILTAFISSSAPVSAQNMQFAESDSLQEVLTDEAATGYAEESTEEIITDTPAQDSTNEYSDEEYTVPEDTGEAELTETEPQKLIYSKYIFGNSIESDSVEGTITYHNSTDGNNNALIKVDPDEYSGTSWISPLNTDSVGIHTEANGSPCYFITKYIRNNGTGTTSPGYVYFNMGKEVTPEDKSFTFEVEAYDNSKSSLVLRYVSGYNSSNKPIFKTSSESRGDTDTWKTFTYEISDAHFNGEYPTGLAKGESDFRIEASSTDTYIKSVAVYNSKDYKEHFEALELLELETEVPYEDNFRLPSAEGFDIEWYSSDEETVYTDGDVAVILPDYEEKTATLTARLIKNGYYTEKSFDIILKALERETIEFSGFKVSEAAGTGTVAVDIRNGGGYRGKITLFAIATDRTTGEIKGINMDSFVGGTANDTTLEASIPLEENQQLKYCMLDSKGASLKNNPPSKPGNLRYTTGFDNMEIMWDKAYDDYNAVKRYEISVDDVVIGEAETEETSFTAKDLLPGNEYKFSVKAIDNMNACSQAAVLDVMFPQYAWIDLGDPQNGEFLSMIVNENVDTGDSYSESFEINGIKGRKIVDRGPINGKSRTWLYFKTDKELISSEDRTVTFEITYLDTGKKNMVLQYNAEDGSPAKNKVIVNSFGNTNELKTVTVTIDDAMFSEHSSLTRCDFRLGSNQAGGEIYVVKVRATTSK